MESILDVIESGRWKRALFTTYVFSLSFFESILLRKLRQVGCQEIWVVADVHGYRMSLIERRSRAVGHEYRLVPVRLANGVFHPKCLYLEGASEDALAVGSGNVTFGGFGRNLEVIETFSSAAYGKLFVEFADFLAAVRRRRSDLECPNLTWAETFEARSRSIGTLGNAKPSAFLLHSVETPIVDQLADQITEAETLTVLSPFYDHDGFSVKTLAAKLNCKEILIGVPSNARASNFPFSAAKKWGPRVEAVWSKEADSERSLHAKWFELRSQLHNSVMTGSANATRQALCTTNNIEVSVLHTRPNAHEWIEWGPSKIPLVFEPPSPSSPSSTELLAHANLFGEVLQGHVLGLTGATGRWDGVLTRPGGETKEFTTQVKEDGTFHVTDLEFLHFGFSSGVQIQMHCNLLRARGWVDSEDVLRISRIPNLNLGAFVRIISRENTEDDDVALLEYLAINAEKHLRPFAARIKSVQKKKNGDSGASVIHIDLEELAPTDAPSGTSTREGELVAQSLDRVMSQLRKRLLGHGADATEKDVEEGEEAEVDALDPDEAATNFEPDNDNSAKGAERVERAADCFDRKMRGLIQSPDLKGSDLPGVLVLWFEVTMCMLLLRQKDKSRALQFLTSWAHTVARLASCSSEIDPLEQHFVTSIALLGVRTSEDPRTLHELLEFFYRAEVTAERVNCASLPASGVPFGMFDCGNGEFLDELNRIRSSTTLRQELTSIIRAAKRGEEIDAESPIFQGQAGQIILDELRRVAGMDRFVEQRGSDSACAKCSETLPKIMASSLQNCRIAFHKGWFTVRTKR